MTAAVVEVVSRDGTRLACHREGVGSPVILVHGGTADHAATWAPVLPELARSFTVFALDRRGHGASGDARRYALEREFEDVAAVVDAVGAPAALVGHSLGALVSLEAALLTPNVCKLVLYEGIPARGADHYGAGALFWLAAAVRLGGWRKVAGTRSQARILLREVRAHARYGLRPERFADVVAPTLVLAGAESSELVRADATAVARALPHGRAVELPGQGHGAIAATPALFLAEVRRFLAPPWG